MALLCWNDGDGELRWKAVVVAPVMAVVVVMVTTVAVVVVSSVRWLKGWCWSPRLPLPCLYSPDRAGRPCRAPPGAPPSPVGPPIACSPPLGGTADNLVKLLGGIAGAGE